MVHKTLPKSINMKCVRKMKVLWKYLFDFTCQKLNFSIEQNNIKIFKQNVQVQVMAKLTKQIL